MTTRNRISLSEKQAVLIWQQVIAEKLTSSEGDPVSVIFQGGLVALMVLIFGMRSL